MLRRLVAIFALITGLTALAAPAAAWVPPTKSSEISAGYAHSAYAGADAKCQVDEDTRASKGSKKSKGKAVKKRIIIVSPTLTGVDRALE